MVFLTISIVTYQTPQAVLEEAWRTIEEAAKRARAAGLIQRFRLILVDNTSPPDPMVKSFVERLSQAPIELCAGHGNVGFGAGHNLALRDLDSDYHLILNADVELAPDALAEALR